MADGATSKGSFAFDPERDLRILRDELYEGSWELMLRDLEGRLEKKPPVYKITENIKSDIALIRAILTRDHGQPATGT